MRVLVVGASGGTGRAVVEELLERGHHVTAFARRPTIAVPLTEGSQLFTGDATKAVDVERAVAGHDAVIVALGIHESPLRVRLRGSVTTPMNVRSAGTTNVVAAMRKHGAKTLVVQSSYGVGETRDRLPLQWRLIFSLLLKPQIQDTEVQEGVVRESGLDWTLVQPVGLTSGPKATPFVSVDGETRQMRVSRRSVAQFLVEAAETGAYVGRSVAVSAP